MGGHSQSTSAAFSPSAWSELQFLSQHLFFSGLDKASNNASIICIYHLRVQALQRLESDFEPALLSLQDTKLDLQSLLGILLPEVDSGVSSLPYIMATYKLHKLRYRWLTNAANCIFSGLASIITQLLQLVIIEIKAWCRLRMHTYKQFDRVDSCIYWVIDSLFDFTLNLPEQIFSLYITDITRCYESIPLTGNDNLPDALNFLICMVFQHHHISKRTERVMWVHINTMTGKADIAKWSTNCSGNSCWLPFS